MLFCPTSTALINLQAEGFPHRLFEGTRQQIHQAGDVMYDAALFFAARAEQKSRIIQTLGVSSQKYVLATVHRAENTDAPPRLEAILTALTRVAQEIPVIFPIHPRTRNKLDTIDSKLLARCSSRIRLIDPVGYLDMVALEKNAAVIATDSSEV